MPNEFNERIIAEFRANGGKVGGPFEGAPMVLLTTTGARSGRNHTTPLVHLPLGEGRLAVFASKGGAPDHPAWYYNIRVNPEVIVEVRTERYPARARIAQGEERDDLYRRQSELFPAFAEYQRKTARVIPVVVLERA